MSNEKPRNESEWSSDVEAAYVSALATLDELNDYGRRALVAINWVKYVLLDEAIRSGGEHPERLFLALCNDFAKQVTDIPRQVNEHIAHEGCGMCAHCVANAKREAELRVVVVDLGAPDGSAQALKDLIRTILSGGGPDPKAN